MSLRAENKTVCKDTVSIVKHMCWLPNRIHITRRKGAEDINLQHPSCQSWFISCQFYKKTRVSNLLITVKALRNSYHDNDCKMRSNESIHSSARSNQQRFPVKHRVSCGSWPEKQESEPLFHWRKYRKHGKYFWCATTCTCHDTSQVDDSNAPKLVNHFHWNSEK